MRTINEGFKEANIAHDVSAAFRSEGYLVYPEFPFENGSIDAVFIRDNEVVVSEWKRLYRKSTPEIVDQTSRMMRFDPNVELPKYGFKPRAWLVKRLWVCDVWDEFDDSVNWWSGSSSKIPTQYPFDSTWKKGKESFPDFNPEWSRYSWLWAYR